jgi:flagellar hook assembly protein FlgD
MVFALPRRANVELGIFDLAGRQIATLAHGPAEAGPHEIAWSGRTDSGRPAGPGLYFARLTTEGHEITRKIVRTE